MVQLQHLKAVHLVSNKTMVCQELQIEDKGLIEVKSKKFKMLMACATSTFVLSWTCTKLQKTVFA